MFMKSLVGAAFVALAASPALADYPERPVQVIVPYSAGGGTDLTMRVFAEAFERLFPGANMVIRNQNGGGGSIGSSAVLNSRPDGYTLGAGTQGALVIKPQIGGTDYQLEDVEFLGLYARSLQVLVACKDAPFDNLDDFLTYSATKAPQIGNSGAGGANQISVEAFAKAADITVESVPYDGSAPARTACIGGHIDAMVASPSEAKAASEAGQMTPLFVMENERIDLFPDTPTAVEKGIDFTWSSWKGLIGPKGMDTATIEWLRDAVKQVVMDEQFRNTLTEAGSFVFYETAEEYEARATREKATSGQVLEELGMLGINN